jgi:hypothetical protein
VATADQLAEAEAYEASLGRGAPAPDDETDAKEKLRKQLENSRFEDT